MKNTCIVTVGLALGLLSLTGCDATLPRKDATPQIATFQVEIKEVDSQRNERILHSPLISAALGSTGEWRDVTDYASVEGNALRREGYVVAIQPTIETNSPDGIGMNLVVDQFGPDGHEGVQSHHMAVSDIRSEPYVFWRAAGNEYTASARLIDLQ